ncbi:MAG: hypothetical protein ABSD75_32550, partial [Terriglobales bacterium]
FFGQRGITPAFGYSAPHLGARGTLTLPDNVLLSTRFAYSALACFRMGCPLAHMPNQHHVSVCCATIHHELLAIW